MHLLFRAQGDPRKGISREAILHFIEDNFNVPDPEVARTTINKNIKEMLETEALTTVSKTARVERSHFALVS